jgi:hypothetical protein
MGLDYAAILAPYQEPGHPEHSVDSFAAALSRRGFVPDVGRTAIELILADVANGRKVADIHEIGRLILEQAKGIVADQAKAAGEIVTARLAAAAQWIHHEAIGDAYAVADEAAEVVAEWRHEADTCLQWARSSEARCERLLDNRDAAALERKLFLEAPLWARLWWAFWGRLGCK